MTRQKKNTSTDIEILSQEGFFLEARIEKALRTHDWDIIARNYRLNLASQVISIYLIAEKTLYFSPLPAQNVRLIIECKRQFPTFWKWYGLHEIRRHTAESCCNKQGRILRPIFPMIDDKRL